MIREVSHTEAGAALDCQARHAFAYTGALTGGDALAPKVPHLRLRRGRAWGRAVAAWHETGDLAHAVIELRRAVGEDAAELADAGYANPAEADALRGDLEHVLAHYAATTDPLHEFYGAETELRVPAPSRTGRRGSNRFRFVGYLDGLHTDDAGRTWVVEFKYRGALTPYARLLLDRQVRWYAWAAREALEVDIAGVIVDERLAGAPGPVVLNKPDAEGRRAPRKAQAQCSPEDYLASCALAGVDPDEATLNGLRLKRWHARHYVTLMPHELDEAGRQVASVARLVGDLDAGRLYPVRNPSPARCGGCPFLDICGAPDDAGVVDILFRRVPPKRARGAEVAP